MSVATARLQRSLSARGGDRSDAALQRGHPLLEHRDRGIRDARVDVTRALHVEERRACAVSRKTYEVVW